MRLCRPALAAALIAAVTSTGIAVASGPFSNAAPTILGTHKSDRIKGTKKRDIIWGVEGNDRITARPGQDLILGGSGNDRIDGGPGNDQIGSGSGNDVLIGGSGRDDLDAGSGNDVIYARDGQRDEILCGSGRDRVVADKTDQIAPNCERVSRRSTRARR